MHHQVKFLEERTKYNPQDDQAYASWGSILVHLSIMSEDQAEKAQYLQQSFEKLEKAISINEESKTHEGELAIFCLGNAFYFKFFLEKNDEIAEKFLKKARIKFELAVKKDKKNPMYTAMVEQLATAHDQRRATLEHLKRMEGKSEEEKHAELRLMQAQMLENVVDNCRAQLAQDASNVGVRSASPHAVHSRLSCIPPFPAPLPVCMPPSRASAPAHRAAPIFSRAVNCAPTRRRCELGKAVFERAMMLDDPVAVRPTPARPTLRKRRLRPAHAPASPIDMFLLSQ